MSDDEKQTEKVKKKLTRSDSMESDKSVESVESLGSVRGPNRKNWTLEGLRDAKIPAVSSQPPTSPPGQDQKVTYKTISNFFAGFPTKNIDLPEQKVLGASSSDPLSSPTSTQPQSPDDIKAPLLGADKKQATGKKPTTVMEILKLDIPQIEALFQQAIKEATPPRSRAAKAYLALLLSLAIGAILIEPLYSSFMRANIEDNSNYWLSQGNPENISKTAAAISYGSSWGFALLNLLVDMLSVNCVEEAFALFNKTGGDIGEKLKKIRDNFGRWMFHTLAKATIFLPVYAILAAADITGLAELTHINNKSFVIATGTNILTLGLAYYGMFAMGQFEKHLDALIAFSLDLPRSLHLTSGPTPAITSPLSMSPQEAEMAADGTLTLIEPFEKFEKIAAYLEMLRIVMSNWTFRGLSTVYIFQGILHDTMNIPPSAATAKALVVVGAWGFVCAALGRTLQTYTSFFNPDFKQLSRKEISEAKVDKLQRAIDGAMTLVSGGSIAALAYLHGPENKLYASLLAGFLGGTFSLVTGTGSNYRSKREAALAARTKAIDETLQAMELTDGTRGRKDSGESITPPSQNLEYEDEHSGADEDRKESKPSKSAPRKTSRLHEVLAMTVSEVFDQIIILSKSGALITTANIVNDLARTARIMMFGGFLANMASLFSEYGIEIPLDFASQLAATLMFALPVQIADAKVFKMELVGNPGEPSGNIPYLLAKSKIGGFGSRLLTPKEGYEYEELFRTLCKLDPVLNAEFQAAKQFFSSKVSASPEDEDDFIFNLQQQVKVSYSETINRLAEWVSNPQSDPEAELIAELQKDPVLKSYIKDLKSPSQKNEFTGKDYPHLKQLEWLIFQEKMYRLVDDVEWEIDDQNLIEEYRRLQKGDYPISLEALALIRKYEVVHPTAQADITISVKEVKASTPSGVGGEQSFFSSSSSQTTSSTVKGQPTDKKEEAEEAEEVEEEVEKETSRSSRCLIS